MQFSQGWAPEWVSRKDRLLKVAWAKRALFSLSIKVAAEALGRKLSNHDKCVPIRLALLVHDFEQHIPSPDITEPNLIGGGERFLD